MKAARDAGCFRVEAGAFAKSAGWQAAAKEGWMGLCLSRPAGAGLSALDTVTAFEALGEAGASRGAVFATGAHLFGAATAMSRFGSADEVQDLLDKLAAGQAVGALALTEPSGGSTLSAMETVIRDLGRGELSLAGAKTYVTNATQADVLLVLAREDGAPPPMNLTVLLVPADTSGVTIEPLAGGRGLAGADMGRVRFDGCVLPECAVLGRRRAGLAVFMAMMQWERSCILAGNLGALERDFRAVCAHLEARRDANGSLTAHQAVCHPLADVQARIEAARLILYRGAWSLDQGKDAAHWPSISKLTLAETLVECHVILRQLMAGAGWSNQAGIADALDDALAVAAASGTSEIQRTLIATRLHQSGQR
ncbi:acyl-CoA dehydrogenase family protein [Roseicyclus mahoneyensis]|nr:acyl-CoA dehydrogenase family protein [Roseicyclus mahoneyensis]